ncbi:DoxX family membrane protein [Candidatus Binatus sp.]|uniref:DoxX family membrane protein n=1 Tax=Candidatus Binatus sp. TaxID=2811406 RepID=UPI002F937223
MRIVVIVARILLGLVFLVFGLNGLLHFMPNPPEPPPAAAFFGALWQTHYMFALISGTQVLGGALLVLGVAVPFALVILAPVLVNIVAFHLFLSPAMLPMALVMAALEAILAWHYRAAFAPLFGPASRP